MPSAPDVRATSHDRHDAMLVAALAAGDLAGTERDQAIALTRSCTECASLHADLAALARATATLPPPIASAGRDFRLTPAQAAGLRRTGWRRLVPALRTTATSRLGVGLATIGLAGLLVGNVSIGFGSAGAAPQAASGPASVGATSEELTGRGAGATQDTTNVGAPAASAAAAPVPAPSAAASMAPVYAESGGPASGGGDGVASLAATPTPPGRVGAADTSGSAKTGDGGTESGGSEGAIRDAYDTPSRPLNLVFGGAVVLGIALLIASRIARRPRV